MRNHDLLRLRCYKAGLVSYAGISRRHHLGVSKLPESHPYRVEDDYR